MNQTQSFESMSRQGRCTFIAKLFASAGLVSSAPKTIEEEIDQLFGTFFALSHFLFSAPLLNFILQDQSNQAEGIIKKI